MVDYDAMLRKSVRFAVDPARWLQFFIIDSVFFISAMVLAASRLERYISMFLVFSSNSGSYGTAFVVFWEILPFIFIGVLWFLARLYVLGAVTHQCYKEKEISKGFYVSKKKYLSLLGAVIIITIVNGLLGIVPLIGILFVIITSLVFFLVSQSIIIGNKGFYTGIVESWELFKKRPANVILTFILVALISILIFVIFSAPLFIIYAGIAASGVTGASAAAVITPAIVEKLPVIIISIFASMLGVSIANCFGIKSQTELYLQLRKKRGLFFRR